MQMQVEVSKRPVYKKLTTLSKFRTPPLFFFYIFACCYRQLA